MKTTVGVSPDELEAIIRENHLPAEIKEFGQTWVRVEVTDDRIGVSKMLSMGVSDFVDLILHWREHGCHEHPCSALMTTPPDDEHLKHP
jgi:hypothetical protein